VRLIEGAPLPPAGSASSTPAGSSRSRAPPLLVFVDADVRVEPEAWPGWRPSSGSGAWSRQRLPTPDRPALGEIIAIPQILVVLLGYLPLPMSRQQPTDPRFAAACGQSWP
jgi:hypothetical protein